MAFQNGLVLELAYRSTVLRVERKSINCSDNNKTDIVGFVLKRSP